MAEGTPVRVIIDPHKEVCNACCGTSPLSDWVWINILVTATIVDRKEDAMLIACPFCSTVKVKIKRGAE